MYSVLFLDNGKCLFCFMGFTVNTLPFMGFYLFSLLYLLLCVLVLRFELCFCHVLVSNLFVRPGTPWYVQLLDHLGGWS